MGVIRIRFPRMSRASLIVLGFILVLESSAADTTGVEFYEKRVRPIFVERCYKCHSADAEKIKGGLRLDTKERWMEGGESGPVVVPGKADQSLMIKAVRYEDEDLQMPPKTKLPDAEIAVLVKWVEMGAPYPAEAGKTQTPNSKSQASHWAWQPVKKSKVPAVRDSRWAKTPVDNFILAGLETQKLGPAPAADRRILIRRLSFALRGLPPSPQEISDFLADSSPRAYEKLVDRLLDTPQFGERWARHWLDLVRYAETHGSEGDPPIPHAWRYRDYLIRAFNGDVPYDQLVREHIAGDLLPNPRWNRAEHLNESSLGTAHWRFVEHGFQPIDTLDEQVNSVENQIDVLGKTFQGLTLACARCHDHKFDAITQRDYYALYGILASTRPAQITIDDPAMLATHREKLQRLKMQIKVKLADAWSQEAAVLPQRLLESLATQEEEMKSARLRADEVRTRIREREQQVFAIEKPAREQILRARGKTVAVTELPSPLAAWNFEGDARDAKGNLHGQMFGGARVERGRLILDGKGAFARTEPLQLGRTLREKTLEAWVALSTLDQGGGGVITVETRDGVVFDSIVFAERQAGKWMAGSDFGRRTRDFDVSQENAKPTDLVHMAIVYAGDNSIALFRNGVAYGKAYKPAASELQTYNSDARVLFGMRHTGGGRAFLAGEIEEARLYDHALNPAQLAASFQAGPQTLTTAELLAAMTDAQRQQRAALIKEIEQLRSELEKLSPEQKPADPWRAALTDAVKNKANPLHAWMLLREKSPTDLQSEWRALDDFWRGELESRRKFNRENFKPLWDLTANDYEKWFKHGVGLPVHSAPAGEFFIEPQGDRVINGIYPAGVYSHLSSQKLNGVLTSPRFQLPATSLSVRFLGDRGGGVRVIVDNYPLGENGTYPQDRPSRDEMSWVRLDTSYRKGSMAYIEFATYDDLTRARRPERKDKSQGEDGRSYFGVAQVVFHDGSQLPKDETAPIAFLLQGETPQSPQALSQRYSEQLQSTVAAWRAGRLSESQQVFLDYFVRKGLLSNSLQQLPAVAALVEEYRRLEKDVPTPRRAPGVLEAAGFDQPLMTRGNHKQLKESVPRRYLDALGAKPCQSAQSGRLELAQQIASAKNPLTARVIVNRLWHHLFGRGLVPTVDNFGRLGEKPSHPELLDYLAARFIEDGWSVKRMIRLLVTSQTYQMSAGETSPAALQLDPANQFFARFPVRRLEAEAIRDAMLAVSGQLNPQLFGPSVGSSDNRRSLYLATRRTAPQAFLDVFDQPRPASTRGARDATNLPAQSLMMMNDGFVTGLARAWANQLSQQKLASPDERVRQMFLQALGREPTELELKRAREFLARLASELQMSVDQPQNHGDVLQPFAQSLFNLKEFIYMR